MTVVAETLGVSRSNLLDRTSRESTQRGPYRKPDDELLLPAIRRLVDERPSYGYRRITALLNSQLRAEGRPAVVRVLFVIDACDREIIAWSATTAGISGEMVRDLMVVAVERRFGSTKASTPVEWLSDNGSAYIAKETSHMATALGLRLAFTPVRSSESNGISEAFVKTLKRDYARHNVLADAPTVMVLLPAWFDDYNEVHPHSGLRFLSPREFLRRSA